MPEPIRFHLDEHVHPAVATGLQRRGIDVTTSGDARLLSADDGQQLAYASHSGRVLVTQDEGFLALAARGLDHAGICYCHQQSRTVRQIIETLHLLHECYDAEDMRNRVEFI